MYLKFTNSYRGKYDGQFNRNGYFICFIYGVRDGIILKRSRLKVACSKKKRNYLIKLKRIIYKLLLHPTWPICLRYFVIFFVLFSGIHRLCLIQGRLSLYAQPTRFMKPHPLNLLKLTKSIQSAGKVGHKYALSVRPYYTTINYRLMGWKFK